MISGEEEGLGTLLVGCQSARPAIRFAEVYFERLVE